MMTDSKLGAQKRHEVWEWSTEVRVAAAEAAGTALLVLLTCLGGASGAGGAAAAARAGGVVALLVQAFDHVSGAMFNPTVTLAALVYGRVSAPRAASAALAQLAGAALGAAALLVAAPADAARALSQPAPGCRPYEAACVEAVAGGCLALVNCAAWDARNVGLRDSWPLRIGASVAALSLVAGPLTGASMNPARSLGPALLLGRWTHHWIYWVGPLGGSLAFSALYVAVWRAPPAAGARRGRPPHAA